MSVLQQPLQPVDVCVYSSRVAAGPVCSTCIVCSLCNPWTCQQLVPSMCVCSTAAVAVLGRVSSTAVSAPAMWCPSTYMFFYSILPSPSREVCGLQLFVWRLELSVYIRVCIWNCLSVTTLALHLDLLPNVKVPVLHQYLVHVCLLSFVLHLEVFVYAAPVHTYDLSTRAFFTAPKFMFTKACIATG